MAARTDVTNCDIKFGEFVDSDMAAKNKGSVETPIVTLAQLERKIFDVRERQVMLDSDLAKLYGVETKMLTRAVRRNLDRFPDDFMFQITKDEFENLRRQIGASSSRNYGGRRYMPYVFTEQGVAMLSSVLNSERAVQVNIAIMRAFVNMRKLAASNEEIRQKIALVEKRLSKHDEHFKMVFGAIKAMLAPTSKTQKQIGYIQKKK